MSWEIGPQIVFYCTTCRDKLVAASEDHHYLAEEHANKSHYLCSCGRWFVGIDVHRRRCPDHTVVEEGRGVLREATEQRRFWKDDPPPPILPPRVGYRCWRLYPQLPLLMPLAKEGQTPWLPGHQRFEAKCNMVIKDTNRPFHTGPPPGNKNCVCGFWGLADLGDALTRSWPVPEGIAFHGQRAYDAILGKQKPERTPFLVAGAVELYGDYIEGKVGWRSQYAGILALWLVPNWTMGDRRRQWLTEALVDLYQVPVVASRTDLVAAVEERRVLNETAEAVEHLAATELVSA